MKQCEKMLNLAERFYDAALDESLWPHALLKTCELFNSGGVYLFMLDQRTGLVPFGLSHGLPLDETLEYDARYVLLKIRARTIH